MTGAVHGYPESTRLGTLCGADAVPPGDATTGFAMHWTCDACLRAAGLRSCPACGVDAVWVRTLRRSFHEDGSDNTPCWRADAGTTSGRPA